jgi:hypothetical protein
MENHDPTPGSVPPAGWSWPASSSAAPIPVAGLNAEAIQALMLNPAALFHRQLEGNADAYPFLRNVLLAGQGQAALNSHQQNQGIPAPVAPVADAQEVHVVDDIPGEDKVRLTLAHLLL